MAAEAADGPSPPPPGAGEAAEPPAAPEDEQQQQHQSGEDRPEPKRRRARARITALESVPRAAEVAAAAAAATAAAAEAAGRDDEPEAEHAGGCDGGAESFSFHARGFSSAQTTPKFGSFNPGAAAELVAFHLMKASRRRVDPQAAEEPGDRGTAAGGDEEEAAAAEGSDGNSR
ncbi:unnamed protein product [Urochloa humidicola]